MSTLTQNQKLTLGPVPVEGYGPDAKLTVKLRFDDECRNGHNTFSITGEIRQRGTAQAFGTLHQEIAKAFPELEPLIKWHLCSTDGPLHYISNTVFWVQQGREKFDNARACAIWPDATYMDLCDPWLRMTLADRLPGLLAEFRQTMENLGFKW